MHATRTLSAKPRAFQPVAQAGRARRCCVRPHCSRADAAPVGHAAAVDRRAALALLLGSSAYAYLQPGAANAGLPAQVGSYLPPYGDPADELVLFVPDGKKTPVRSRWWRLPRSWDGAVHWPIPAPPAAAAAAAPHSATGARCGTPRSIHKLLRCRSKGAISGRPLSRPPVPLPPRLRRRCGLARSTARNLTSLRCPPRGARARWPSE
jgi:hypothetical protein